MATPFTDHVRALALAAGPVYPGPEFWDAFARALRSQMKKRGLLTGPPEYLAYGQYRDWKEPGAFDLLLWDCYEFCVLARLRGLAGRLLDLPNVEGIVHGNIGKFLTARQKANDPIGHAVFKNVVAALQRAVDERLLRAEQLEDGKVDSDTVLHVSGSGGTGPLLIEALKRDEQWPHLIAAMVRTGIRAQRLLREALARLGAVGVRTFRCDELVEALKPEARGYWDRRFGATEDEVGREGGTEEEPGDFVRVVLPGTDVEDRDSFRGLLACIEAGLDAIRQERRRKSVRAVFHELLDIVRSEPDRRPKQSDVGRVLGMPAATLSDCFKTLREIAMNCSGRSS